MKKAYIQFITEHNKKGSNKASSYIQALNLLGPILQEYSKPYCQYSNVWSIHSIKILAELYDYVIEQQTIGDRGIFQTKYLPSYWRSRFYSAALKSYKEFQIIQGHENRLWEIFRKTHLASGKVSELLAKEQIEAIEELIPDKEIDFSTKEGKEVLRETKARVNQSFFRKMILKNYRMTCSVSGLTIPEVLRASHIVPWAKDAKNRLNPCNGLCLSATYDAAFDRHLISFDEDYRMIFSSNLKEYHTNEAFQKHFKCYKGNKLLLPDRFLPHQEFLEKHRKQLA